MAMAVGMARRWDMGTSSSAAKTPCVHRVYSFAALRTPELAFFAWTSETTCWDTKTVRSNCRRVKRKSYTCIRFLV